MAAVDPKNLEPAADLWWFWAVLAATHQAIGNKVCDLDPGQHVLRVDSPGGSWVRMQRIRGGRAVLWGRDVDSEDDALSHGTDVLAGVPGWAVTEPVEQAVHVDGVGFLAWHDRAAWQTSTPNLEDGADWLLEPLLDIGAIAREVRLVHQGALIDVLPRVVADARAAALTPQTFGNYLHGDGDAVLGHALLVAAREEAEPATHHSAHDALRVQIHEQMKATPDTEGRKVAARPAVLARWARVAAPDFAFEHAVMVERGRLIGATDNPPLPDRLGLTLTNVLQQLHLEEAHEDSGAWLFARVSFDGSRVSFDRVFDGWPSWFRVPRAVQGPSLEGLSWEMDQRTDPWRPAWASLLPLP